MNVYKEKVNMSQKNIQGTLYKSAYNFFGKFFDLFLSKITNNSVVILMVCKDNNVKVYSINYSMIQMSSDQRTREIFLKHSGYIAAG
jgi:hypothetical protein